MNSEGKASMIALVLLVTNWHWSRTIQRPNITSSIHADGPTVTFLLCSIALVILLLGLYRLLRALLDGPVRISRAVRLASWRPVLLLVPLLFNFSSSHTTTTADTTTIVSLGYGCEASTPLFVVSAAMLIVFQSVSELLRIYRDGHAHSR